MATWASLGSTELFTYNELQDAVTNGVLPAKGPSIPTTDECVTKADIGTYVHNNIDAPSYAALASNEELTKGDMVASTCRQVRLTVNTIDLSNADDGYVYFRFVDCCGVTYTSSWNTPFVNYAPGISADSRFGGSGDVGPFIISGGVETPASFSSYSFFDYTTGCIAN